MSDLNQINYEINGLIESFVYDLTKLENLNRETNECSQAVVKLNELLFWLRTDQDNIEKELEEGE